MREFPSMPSWTPRCVGYLWIYLTVLIYAVKCLEESEKKVSVSESRGVIYPKSDRDKTGITQLERFQKMNMKYLLLIKFCYS